MIFSLVGFLAMVIPLVMSVVSFIQMLTSITSTRSDSSYMERFYGFSALGYLFIGILYGALAGIGVI